MRAFAPLSAAATSGVMRHAVGKYAANTGLVQPHAQVLAEVAVAPYVPKLPKTC